MRTRLGSMLANYLRWVKIRRSMGEMASFPYFVWAARIRAWRCCASNTGASEGGSERTLAMTFARLLRLRSAFSKGAVWQMERTALSNSRRMMLAAWFASSFRVGVETNAEARTRRSNGRSPTLSTNRTRSKCRKISPSPLSIPSRKRSARIGSRPIR